MRLKQAGSTTTTTNTGSANLWLLGRSFRRLEGEDDNGGGGGTGQTQTTTNQNGDTGGSKERTYTAAEVEGIVRDRLARVKTKAPEPDKKPSGKAEPNDPTWVFDLTDAIEAQTEERNVKVPQGLKKRMRAAFAAERPSDPNAWVGTWLDDVGLVKAATKETTTTTADTKTADKAGATDTTTSNGKPISDKGTAAVPGRDIEEITNPNDLTQVDIERIHKKHGEDGGNQLISAMALKWLEGVKIVPDYGGPKKR